MTTRKPRSAPRKPAAEKETPHIAELKETPGKWRVFKHETAALGAEARTALAVVEGVVVRGSGRVVHAKIRR